MLSEPQVEADGEIVIDAERNLRAKYLVGRKVAQTFKGHKGLFHGTVRRIFEVKPKNKFAGPRHLLNFFSRGPVRGQDELARCTKNS